METPEGPDQIPYCITAPNRNIFQYIIHLARVGIRAVTCRLLCCRPEVIWQSWKLAKSSAQVPELSRTSVVIIDLRETSVKSIPRALVAIRISLEGS